MGRSDGDLVPDVAPYRRMEVVLFPRRNDSAVHFTLAADVTDTLAFIERWNDGRPPEAGKLTLFTFLLHAVARTLERHPRLNRFVAGSRLYQRRGVWLSYTAKKAMTEAAPLVVVKRRFPPGETLDALVRDLHARVRDARSDAPSYADKEVALFLKLPLFLLRLAIRAVRRLDAWGLLPAKFIENDPFFASAFLTNLGSIGVEAGYHHLFEYGTIPFFIVLGRAKDGVVARDGAPAVRKVAAVKIVYDERVEDGFNAAKALLELRHVLERPEELA